MPRITSLEDLDRLRMELVRRRSREAAGGMIRLAVGMGLCGIAAGAVDVFHALEDGIKTRGLKDVILVQTGCMGLCKHEPIVEVTIGTQPTVSYGSVTPELAEHILSEHVVGGNAIAGAVIDTAPFPAL